MNKTNFLCCFCGLIITSNRRSLDRHERLHDETIQKFKCCAKNCRSTFQNKTNYYVHWHLKHKGSVMPDYFEYIYEKRKPKLKFQRFEIPNENISKVVNIEKVIDLDISSADMITATGVKIENVINNCFMREPCFGQMNCYN